MIKIATRKNREIPDEKVREIVSLWYEGIGARLIAEIVGVNYSQVRSIRCGDTYVDITGGRLDEKERLSPDPHISRKRAIEIRPEKVEAPRIFDPDRNPKLDPIAGDVLCNTALECTVLGRESNVVRYESRGRFNSAKINTWMDLHEWQQWANNPTYFVEVRKRGDMND